MKKNQMMNTHLSDQTVRLKQYNDVYNEILVWKKCLEQIEKKEQIEKLSKEFIKKIRELLKTS